MNESLDPVYRLWNLSGIRCLFSSRGPDTVLRMPDISSTAPEQNHLHIMSLALVTTEQQIQTCLFIHKFIVVSEEGSKLCWSMGEDFEDIGQKASL